MTMKVTEHQIVVERKGHPSDVRYPCRGTHEIMDAGRKLISSLSSEERKQMLSGDLILDEEETAELFDAVREDDIIGLGIFRRNGDNPGFSSNMYRVIKLHTKEDWIECENSYTKLTEEISFQDFSIALALNLAEILYREDKPFGVSQEEIFTLRIHADDKEDGIETTQTSDLDDISENEAPVVSGGNSSAAKISKKEESNDNSLGETTKKIESESTTEDNIQKITDEHTKTPTAFGVSEKGVSKQSKKDMENEENVLPAETPEKEMEHLNLKWPDCYFAFGYNSDDFTYYVLVNPKNKWNTEGVVDKKSSADLLAESLELNRLAESTYEYNHKYSESQLRMIFKAFNCEENLDMLP